MAHIKKPEGYKVKFKPKQVELNLSPEDQSPQVPVEQSQKTPVEAPTEKLELYHSVSSALNTAINTIGTELAKLRVRSVNNNYSLDEKELKALNDFFKTLIAYEAHQAALAKQAALTGKLADLSDEELLKLANTTLNEKENK